MSDATPATPTADELLATPPRRRRRRGVVAIVVVVVLVVLIAAAGIGGEALARSVGTQTAQRELASALGVADPADVDVDLGSGSVLFQALRGRLDRVTASTDQLTFSDIKADLSLDAEGVPLAKGDVVHRVTATVAISEKEAEKLATRVTTLPVDSVSFGAQGLTIGGTATVLGISLPVSVVFVPSVSGGRLVLTPTTAEISGQKVSVADLRSGPFAAVASAIPQDISVCVNEKLPAGVGLSAVTVRGNDVLLTARGDGVALGGGGKGRCT